MNRTHLHVPAHIGDKIADAVANAIGSWAFIIIQAAIMAVWIVINTLAIFQVIRFDAYPFIFLNLAMSAEAAFSAPIIMQSQNRQAARDHMRDDIEAQEVASIFNNHQELLDINRKLLVLQNQQMEILSIIKPK